MYNEVVDKTWVPPLSPWGLIQETLWPDAWAVMVACIMLNQTQRKQVDKILPAFLKRWPTALSIFEETDTIEISGMIKPLGFGNRRTSQIVMFASDFLSEQKDVRDWSGIGQYGRAAYMVFFERKLPLIVKDHALAQYIEWLKMMGYDRYYALEEPDTRQYVGLEKWQIQEPQESQ